MKKLLATTCLFLILHIGFSQEFKGGLLVGATTSQVIGDDIGGFSVIGATFGAFIVRDFSDKISGEFDLRFSQKGSGDGVGYFRINLGYIEMPLIVQYKSSEKLFIKAGFALGLKVFESTTVSSYKTQTSNFWTYDVPIHFGIEYMLKDNFGIDLRTSYSCFPISYRYVNWTLYAAAHLYIIK